MNKRLFLATTAAIAIATSAFAQSSPSTSSPNPSATQRQQDSTSTTSPSSSASTPSSASSGSQTNPSTNSAQTQSPSSTGQTAAGQSSKSGSGTNTTQAPASNNSTNQAQTNQPSNQSTTPSNQAQTNSPSSTNNQAHSANPPSSNTNQAQSPSGSGSTNAAQQPNNQQNTADRSSSNTNLNASVNINDQQRTRISASISHLNLQPLTNVNFSLSEGTVVPRDVRLQPLPAEVVEIVPQYRGYDFVLVKDEIVIVEPSTYKIVTVLPYSGRSTASAPARTEQRKVTFSDRDREVIRKHAKVRPVVREKQVTTGSTVRTEIRTGERVPEGVEIEAFPEEVYRDAPALREYRYINRDSRTYIVEPHERRVIEEID